MKYFAKYSDLLTVCEDMARAVKIAAPPGTDLDDMVYINLHQFSNSQTALISLSDFGLVWAVPRDIIKSEDDIKEYE